MRGGSTALLLGLGGGVLAWGGASALLSQVGIAVGAAAGGALLIQMITGQRAPTGWTLALPAGPPTAHVHNGTQSVASKNDVFDTRTTSAAGW